MSWLAATCFAPVLDEAVAKLPPTGSIEQGTLHWPEKTGRLLAANPFISLNVTTDNFQPESAPVDFEIEFGTNQFSITSLFGSAHLNYPVQLEIELNRTALSPAWGAWRAPILFGIVPAVALMLMMTWGVLATAYMLLPMLIGAVFNRQVSWSGAWKLSVAAQLPGSLIMAFALALYSTGRISLVFVFVMFVAHVIPTVVYLLISPFFASKAEQSATKQNPFEGDRRRKFKGKNPFASK